MKSKDIFTFILVAVVSGVLSIVISNMLITGNTDKEQTVEVIEPIVSDFQRPPVEYYNSDSVNPTQTIEIGSETQSQPFGEQ